MWSPRGWYRRWSSARSAADIGLGLYYAISDNPNRRWSLTNTSLELGYRPQDSWTALPGAEERVVEGGAPVRDGSGRRTR